MGTQRCPMATYRTNLAAQTTLRWPGPALAGDASGTQRDFMDLRHRGAVARTAQEISAVPDLPSPFPALGAGGQTGTHLARSSGGVAGSRKIATGGGFHRRLLHGGKKRGLAVGPTKRGKGTKIIALADDHSLPLAVSIESASPHESQLVEGVLGHSFLATLPARLIGDKAYDSDRLDRELAERYGINRNDRTASRRAPKADARWSPSASLPPTLASRTTFRLAASFSAARDSLGVPRRELLRHGSSRLHSNPVQVLMRPVLVT